MDNKVFNLLNRGLTCYLDAALQFINMIPEISNYILNGFWIDALGKIYESKSDAEIKEILNKSVIVAMYLLFKQIECIENRNSFGPEIIFNKIKIFNQDKKDKKSGRTYYFEGIQYDSLEFLTGLIYSLFNEIYNIEHNQDLFYFNSENRDKIKLEEIIKFKQTQQICSRDKETIYSTTYYFSAIYSLDITGDETNIGDILQKNSIDDKKHEPIDYYILRNGVSVDYIKKIIIEPSKYLILHLKLFRQFYITKRDGSISKGYEAVKLKKINLEEYLNINGKKYFLISVVKHIGSLDSGHYINYSKKNGRWYYLDDLKSIKEVTFKEFNKNQNGRDPYILLYKVED